MKKTDYEVLKIGINDTKEATRGKDIFYQCGRCQTIIPSMPKDNQNCACGNIGLDKDLNRLFVEDYSSFILLKKKI